VRVTVAATITEVERLRPLWRQLQTQSRSTIFQDFDWNLLALRTFVEEKPYFVAAELATSAAIVPAVIRESAIRLAGGPLFDYRDALCAGDDTAFNAALEKVAELEMSWNIHGIRYAQGTPPWSAAPVQPWTAAPYVSARDISAETFAEKHTRARRSLRRLSEQGASVRTVAGTPELIEQLYREKAKEPAGHGENIFRDPRCVEFMRDVVGLPNTRCEVFLIEAAGNPIAALITFSEREVRRFYTTWMDQQWSKHSPGVALLYHATWETLAAGLDCDYMTGEQPYKTRFATGSVPLYKLECSSAELRASFVPEELKAA
jgi:CelD/BcsL family acetyltransferase involved in cellulose biosynthesis